MSIYRQAIAALGIVATIALGGVSPAAASVTDNGQGDPAIAAALRRIAGKTHTPADITLIKKHPEIAAHVPDPTRAPEKSVTVSAPTGATRASFEIPYCFWVEVTLTVRTLTDFVHYRWVHHIDACTDYVNILSTSNHVDYLRSADTSVHAQELIAASVGPVPADRVRAIRSRKIEFCVLRYGCYGTQHPWSWINLHRIPVAFEYDAGL